MSDTNETASENPSPADKIRAEAEAIINQGGPIRERISQLVARAAEQAQHSGQGLAGLAQSVMDATVSAVNQSVPSDPNSTLRQVIDGLGDGVSKAALATKLAVTESLNSSKSFANEDLQKVVGDVKTLKEMYLQTVTDALGKLKDLTGTQLSDLQKHAVTAQQTVMPALQSAFEAAYNHPVELSKQSVQAGLELSKHSVGGLFSAVGRLLQDAGQRIQADTPEEDKTTEKKSGV